MPSLLNFWVVTKYGSINKAAAELNISQPALTRCLKKLEAALGVVLLERSPLGVRPTRQGDILVEHARTMAANLRQIVRDMDATKRTGGVELRLGVTAFSSSQPVWRVLHSLQRDSPDLRVQVIQRERSELLVLLRRGELDAVIALLAEDGDEPDMLQGKLYDDDVGLYVRATHHLAGRPFVTLRELAAEQWVIPEQGMRTRRLFDQQLRKSGVELRGAVIETSSMLLVRAMLLETDRIALLRSPAVMSEVEQNLVVALKGDWSFSPRTLGYYVREHAAHSPSMSAFLRKLAALSGDGEAKPPAEPAQPPLRFRPALAAGPAGEA